MFVRDALVRMLAPVPFRWNDPSSWSIPIYLWIAFMLLGWIVPLWRWLQRRRAAAWPVVGGRIESADWSKPAFSLTIRRGYYAARLGYSYSVAGTCYSGQYKQEFPTDKEALDFIRDLQDQHITVHYNPNSPGSSTLLASDIDVVLQHRAPSPEGESPLPAESIPDWLRPFIWIFIALSELGLVVSVWVHLAGGWVSEPRRCLSSFCYTSGFSSCSFQRCSFRKGRLGM